MDLPDKNTFFSWLLKNVQQSSESDFIDLIDIKSKYGLPVSAAAVTKLMSRNFKFVKIKKGRGKDNWTKVTQRYYGLSWRSTTNTYNACSGPTFDFRNIGSAVQKKFFLISNSSESIILGHFAGHLINGNKIVIELFLPVYFLHYILHIEMWI